MNGKKFFDIINNKNSAVLRPSQSNGVLQGERRSSPLGSLYRVLNSVERNQINNHDFKKINHEEILIPFYFTKKKNFISNEISFIEQNKKKKRKSVENKPEESSTQQFQNACESLFVSPHQEISSSVTHIKLNTPTNSNILYEESRELEDNSNEEASKQVLAVPKSLAVSTNQRLFLAGKTTARFQTKPIIFLLTDMVSDTLGDVKGAGKLIQCLKAKYPGWKIKWIVRKKIEVKFPEDLWNKADETVVVDRWETMEISWFKNAHLMLHYPANVIYPEEVENQIKKVLPFRTKTIRCSEYNQLFIRKGMEEILPIGFSADCLGIFVESYAKLTIQETLTSINDTRFLQFLGNPEPNCYQQDHLFFLGYFNSNTIAAKNLVNPINFCLIVAAYTVTARQRNLDIVCSFTENDFKSYEGLRFEKYIFKYNVNELILEINGKVKHSLNPHPTADGRKVKITNYFVKDKMMLLMQLAFQSAITAGITPFIGCTGDQSLSEVISLIDDKNEIAALPFYQVMPWKIDLAKNFYQSCTSSRLIESWGKFYIYLGMMLADNPCRPVTDLDSFINISSGGELQQSSYMFSPSRTVGEAVEKMIYEGEARKESFRDFIYGISEILKEKIIAKEMYKYAKKLSEKNLYEILPREIEKILLSSYPELNIAENARALIAQQIDMPSTKLTMCN